MAVTHGSSASVSGRGYRAGEWPFRKRAPILSPFVSQERLRFRISTTFRSKPMTVVDLITSNPIRNRSDLITLLHSIFQALQAGQSPGGARIHLGSTGTSFDPVAAELEGFARALWGLAPLMASEPDRREFEEIKYRWIQGLDSGTNPEEEAEYWGSSTRTGHDQRSVEMAALVCFNWASLLTETDAIKGFALAIAPRVFWDPLSSQARDRLNDWLIQINDSPLPDNNWYCQ